MKNNDKLIIAMLGHKHVPSCEGGIEIVVGELSQRMADLGQDVTCYNRGGHHISGKEHDYSQPRTLDGVKIKKVFTINKGGLAALTSSIAAAWCCIFRKYDVVHVHAEGPAAMCGLLKLFGKKVVVTIHGLDWQRAKWKNGFGAKYIHYGEKMAVKYADQIIVLSQNVKRYFKDTYGRDTVFVPNGINEPDIVPADHIREKWKLEKDSYILFLGRVVPEKGEQYLIEAFKQVSTDKKLVIAGGVSDTEEFEKYLHSLAAGDDRIIFTGFVEGRLKDELYSNAYVYSLPSDLEGMPISLLEAMSYGNCCLTSDIDECSEVVEDKAVMFKKSDVADLREKLQSLCDNPDMVQGYKDKAREFILNKYNWNDVVDKTLDIYRNI